jgi:crotonobetaine/carnitine-CoA ligase
VHAADLEFDDRTIGKLLRHQAVHVPKDLWLMFGEERFTFAEADAAVDRYAAGMQRLGISQGTVVGVMLDNGPDFAFVALGLARLGAVMVPINLELKGRSLRHVLTQSEMTVLMTTPTHWKSVELVANEAVMLQMVVVDGHIPKADVDVVELSVVRAGRHLEEVEVETTDLWCVMYTSGTTGPSKGAAMTHQYWYVAPQTVTVDRAILPDDVFYVCSPMFHAGSWLVQIFPSLLLGLPVGIDEGFSTSTFWDRIRMYGATQILTMAASHVWLWNEPHRDDDADNPARVWAPVPLPPELYEPFKKRFGIDHLWFTYGGTEFMSVTKTIVGEPLKPGSSGRARHGVELLVVDNHDLPVPPGTVGELLVRPTIPQSIFNGYYRNPEATLAAFGNLWYHSGDLVVIDADGELFFVDRKADYLRVRGENVSSFEVESALGDHPGVDEVAAFSLATAEAASVKEDEIKVAIVRTSGSDLTAAALIEFAVDQLPKFAVPRFVEFVDDLPRTATGRVQKHLLRSAGLTETTWDRWDGAGRGAR